MRKALATAAALLALGAAAVTTPTTAQAAVCGFQVGAGGRGIYTHCANTFVLVKGHWSNGATFTRCFEPWQSGSFGPGGGLRVTQMYYVPVRPNLVVGPDGRTYCSLYQPRV
ncbi:DUF6355 family natural product biosynthesis protein [Actinokineospora bangkokensis]|uniref:Secreted protein n=1 Tax=Actinokineospora bangkokensis TaxID=1193682 RepID=A0A1Q9LKM8_9PSEU|nr:DUF6355 family natural product biosynthesis protein [Actinokineospora bangkokensis]OLR92578.1 hypothetical protein BJP25_21225 [Actinokineospora bangkokensis]